MKIQFIKNRVKFYLISVICLVLGLIFMPYHALKGEGALNWDIEFIGGSVIQIDIGKDFNTEQDIRPIIKEVTGDATARIQKVSGTHQVIITTKATSNDQRKELFSKIKEKYSLEDQALLKDDNVSPSISPEIRTKALMAAIIGSLLILLYITIRFKDARYGTSSVFALVHDVLIMVGVYAAFRLPINNSFVAAVLTIIGYSINNTVVVFDRIRENKGKMPSDDETIVDISTNQTLGRSINTSITTLVMVILLYVFGVSSVKEFALPLIVGIVAGTYSSIFIASPIMYDLTRISKNRKDKEQPKSNKPKAKTEPKKQEINPKKLKSEIIKDEDHKSKTAKPQPAKNTNSKKKKSKKRKTS